MNDHPTVIITGSSGLVGSALVSYFAKRGFHVRALQRTPLRRAIELVTYFPFDLADVQDQGFAGADYLIHCAYRPVISNKERLSGINIDWEGTKKLIALSRRYGVKIIFLSTTSAHTGSQSYYAKNKFLVEGLFDAQKDLILKLGLVLGGDKGLFEKIRSNLRRYRIVPLIGGGQQQVQTIALDDLCRVIGASINKNIPGTFMIAHPAPIMMRQLYQMVARSIGAKPLFVPVPLSVAYQLARLIEYIGLSMPFTSQSILGLNDLKIVDITGSSEVFGVAVKDCKTTLGQLHFKS